MDGGSRHLSGNGEEELGYFISDAQQQQQQETRSLRSSFLDQTQPMISQSLDSVTVEDRERWKATSAGALHAKFKDVVMWLEVPDLDNALGIYSVHPRFTKLMKAVGLLPAFENIRLSGLYSFAVFLMLLVPAIVFPIELATRNTNEKDKFGVPLVVVIIFYALPVLTYVTGYFYFRQPLLAVLYRTGNRISEKKCATIVSHHLWWTVFLTHAYFGTSMVIIYTTDLYKAFVGESDDPRGQKALTLFFVGITNYVAFVCVLVVPGVLNMTLSLLMLDVKAFTSTLKAELLSSQNVYQSPSLSRSQVDVGGVSDPLDQNIDFLKLRHWLDFLNRDLNATGKFWQLPMVLIGSTGFIGCVLIIYGYLFAVNDPSEAIYGVFLLLTYGVIIAWIILCGANLSEKCTEALEIVVSSEHYSNQFLALTNTLVHRPLAFSIYGFSITGSFAVQSLFVAISVLAFFVQNRIGYTDD